MSTTNGIYTVKLIKHYQGVNPGETVGYSEAICDKLVEAGIAEHVTVKDNKDLDGIRTITPGKMGRVESEAVSGRRNRSGASGSRST